MSNTKRLKQRFNKTIKKLAKPSSLTPFTSLKSTGVTWLKAVDKDNSDFIEKVRIDLVDIKDVKGFETYGKEVMRDFKKFSRDIQPLLADKRKEFV